MSRKQNTGRDDGGQRGEAGKGGVPQIYVITGGPVYGGTVSGAKASLKEFRHMVNYNDKRYWPNPPRIPHISFTPEDFEGIIFPHDDPLVITVRISNKNVHRVLVDSGSSANILFMDAFR